MNNNDNHDGSAKVREPSAPGFDDMGDDLIVELVTSEIARCCSTPNGLKVNCTRGVVNLAGPVLQNEIPRVLRAASRVPGIVEIHDHLEARRRPMAVSRDRLRRGRLTLAPMPN